MEALEILRDPLKVVMAGDLPKSPLHVTPTELAVMKLVIEGRSVAEIAAELGNSPKTVETHRHNLMKRLQCQKIAQVVAILFRNKLLT